MSNVISASIVCPIYRVGNTITDAWLNLNIETPTPGGKMQCQLVRNSVAKGLPPSKEQFTVDIPIDVQGVLDFKLPEFASNAGPSDVYVLGCMLKPGIEILGYNWEGQ